MMGADEPAICGTMSVVFIVSGQTAITSATAIAGSMRRCLLEAFAGIGADFEKSVTHANEFRAADEIHLRTSRFGLLPVFRTGCRNADLGPIERNRILRPASDRVTESMH
jgi:hypothetical protein